jgi:ATP-dependent RNA helicase RhlE
MTRSTADFQLDWKNLQLSPQVLSLVQKAGFLYPTAIQAQTIPLVMEGHDIIASAQTGSGKTASFVLPLVERFASKSGTFGLILAPTREIAQQTQATLELLGAPLGLSSIVLIGGVDMRLDEKAIQTYPQIIVATPGRLCDHLNRGNLWLDFIQVVVLDEADQMLNMGFAEQLSQIMETVPKNRQTLLFSATFLPLVERLARKIMHSPKRVMVDKPSSSVSTIEQKILWLEEDQKTVALNRLLRSESGSVIVFTRSKDRATRVWRSLHSRGVYDATYIHSDRTQADREKALADFKDGKYRILIATDVAGRGIHVDGISHVVNYDIPLEPEDYIHRIGRTGRQGASGKATSFVTSKDQKLLESIEKIIGKLTPINHEVSGPARTAQRHPRIHPRTPNKPVPRKL